jgi:hypothetical protein
MTWACLIYTYPERVIRRCLLRWQYERVLPTCSRFWQGFVRCLVYPSFCETERRFSYWALLITGEFSVALGIEHHLCATEQRNGLAGLSMSDHGIPHL